MWMEIDEWQDPQDLGEFDEWANYVFKRMIQLFCNPRNDNAYKHKDEEWKTKCR